MCDTTIRIEHPRRSPPNERNPMRRFFYDTEFIESPGHLDLISIGIAGEGGKGRLANGVA